MMFKFEALVAAYLLCLGAAQDTDCSSDIEVSSQADVDKISGCSEFTGKITIKSSSNIVINGVQSIANIEAVNASLSSIVAPELTEITDTLHLQELQYLGTLSMAKLGSIGSLRLQALPQLSELQFNAGVQKANEVIISDTYLQSLSGLNLSDISTFNINNNKNLKNITVGITSVSDALDISFNAPSNVQGVNVSLPALQWANNATFRFCGSVDAPKLESINSSLGFFNNPLTSLNFNTLEKIGDLSIVGNDRLANLSFSGIKELSGALVIANNSKLGSVTGFPNVKVVRGALTVQGNFTKASMPSLERVEGDVNVESNEAFDCKDFDDAHSRGDFFGDKYVCKGASSTVSADINTSTQTGSKTASASATGSGSSSSKNNAPAAGAGSIAGLAAALFSLL